MRKKPRELIIFCCIGFVFSGDICAVAIDSLARSINASRFYVRPAALFFLIRSAFSTGANLMTQSDSSQPLRLLRFGNPNLYQKSAEIELPNEMPLANKILEQMKEATKGIGNVGIAAPQIGIFKRMVMFEIPEKHPRYKTDGIALPMRIMINPSYKPLSEQKNLEWEGCLSVPGMMGLVPRYTHIQYEYIDLDGKFHSIEASNFHARVVQHEFDHLDGILFPMRIEDMRTFGFAEDVMASPLFLENRRGT